MSVDRRGLLAFGALGGVALAASPAAAQGEAMPVWPPAEALPLWTGAPPGAPAVLPVLHPTITGQPGEYRDIQLRGVATPMVGVIRPKRPDGRGVLILPGGGYEFTSQRNEGLDVAATLAAFGITCFVLSYRLPGEGWTDRANVPLQDAQRAMRLIRAQAARYRIDPARLGVIGFSAGGHLAGSLATLHDVAVYAPRDAADRESARPAFAAPIYAVSNMDAGRGHGGSRAQLLGPDPAPGMEARYAPERNLKASGPPLFLLHCEDDDVVPIANSLDTFAAARALHLQTEALFFSYGGHGFGVRVSRQNPASLWPEMFDRWTAGITRTGA